MGLEVISGLKVIFNTEDTRGHRDERARRAKELTAEKSGLALYGSS
jgi:hypothetical protein